MSNQAERIHAALLRFKTAPSTAKSRQVKVDKPSETARQRVVVNEQNLAALFLSSGGRLERIAPEAKAAGGKGS
jgi:hypothetical protein